jgi:5'-phosphate synthase pdxT subunit
VRIGIVGYQGDVAEHSAILERMAREYKRDIDIVQLRSRKNLQNISGLIIPGGESTTIYRLLKEADLFDPIITRVKNGMPVMGTCAGLIIIARDNPAERLKSMNLIDARIRRNGYGRQGDSFVETVEIAGIGDFEAVFIRAPVIESVGPTVDVLAKHNGQPIMIRDNNVLGLTFHPELTGDSRIHDYFLDMIGRRGYISTPKREWYMVSRI